MIDTDVVLLLTGGREVNVIYPDRIGREYETPTLDVLGVREWNVDVDESMHSIPRRLNPRFIIGKWGTGYKTKDGVKATLYFEYIIGHQPLSPEHQEMADAVRLSEDQQRMAQIQRTRLITFEEFEKLQSRVDKLEARIARLDGELP